MRWPILLRQLASYSSSYCLVCCQRWYDSVGYQSLVSRLVLSLGFLLKAMPTAMMIEEISQHGQIYTDVAQDNRSARLSVDAPAFLANGVSRTAVLSCGLQVVIDTPLESSAVAALCSRRKQIPRGHLSFALPVHPGLNHGRLAFLRLSRLTSWPVHSCYPTSITA